MDKPAYIVNAYRFGDNRDHSYSLGVFTKKSAAIETADSHTTYRGGTYICTVEECTLNHFDNDDFTYTTKIYRAG